MKKINLPSYSFYCIAVLLFAAMKYWYTLIQVDSLHFLLWPTNAFIELIVNSRAIYLNGTGYYHDSLNIVIDKSCAGFNFMILCFLMICFLTKKYIHKKNQLLLLATAMGIAYPLTLFANSSRILFSIILEHHVARWGSPEWLHQAEGIFTYLFFLILIYFVVEFFLTNTKFKHA